MAKRGFLIQVAPTSHAHMQRVLVIMLGNIRLSYLLYFLIFSHSLILIYSILEDLGRGMSVYKY